ncbi:2-octaprenyl-6-methoxyphenyl hydroxylase [Vreelandella nanhaiensis]|uniref:2-octaprenyl-6-methoxyphenyl hydroxylase n=1 Tax=Vreelandella nanhaiensis TaxID=1258546 RepID=A0A433KN82_9GAMM|nr:2-octaprenyl-6-methoxyphenyl hydroxylase [Halomonas nanhaiensis]RUR31070.1 2-octaprenyl-6-methoxyphenyl hydroxylase [Halomonas nanhaiensis]
MSQAKHTPTQATTHDIVIVGGGLVGASLGCALAPLIERYGWKVAIIEASSINEAPLEESWQPSFDARASAIAEGSAQRFRQLGVWEAMQTEATPIQHIHISERGRLGSTRLSASEMGVDALGHVIPNAWMGRVLHRHLKALPIEWHCPAKVERLSPEASGHYLRLSDGSELHAALTVLADGGRSGLKEQLGIHSRRNSYEQTALIAHVGVSQPHQGIAYERFTQEGPVALLPLSGQAMELIWTHPSGHEKARMALPEREFLAQLQVAFGDRVGRFTRMGKRYSYPLSLVTADEPVRPGLAVLGNAAHALHPVAGQGFNLALRGIMDLVEALEQGEQAKRPLGEMATLLAFEKKRARDRGNVIRFSDGLVRLFGHSLPLLPHARAAGLIGLNLIGPLRRGLARRAMGLER